ncbi:MAG: PASTA domain-containing protein [Chitinophagaceae bacterium]|nr:PASTA domain-containing protein [Chitinophagaceae bacterium]
MFKSLLQKSFLTNLIAAIGLVLALIFLFFLSLSWLTQHGSYLQVPNLVGMNTDEAVHLLKKQGFEVVITDSAYNDSIPLNTVRRQLPLSDATVKVNRTVFLTVNPVELPMVSMPKLEGLSYRFAANILEKNNLKLGDTTHRPDFMKGSVLDQMYKGVAIAPGTKVRWGSKIDLVIGGGVQGEQMLVPDIVGFTVAETKTILQARGIILASIISSEPIADTASAYVIRQNPETRDFQGIPIYIQPGQTIDIWISVNPPSTEPPDQNEVGGNPVNDSINDY